MEIKPTGCLECLAKGLSVIEVLSMERPRMSIAEVAAATGFDRASSRRSLQRQHVGGSEQVSRYAAE